MHNIPVITMDGPSGSGKGTISRLLAQKFGWHLLDSGALYRLTALGARRHGIDLGDEAAVAAYAASLDVVFEPGRENDEPGILLEGQAVGPELRSESCGNDASRVAALPAVRQALLQRQRDFRQAPGLVADGRDMGTTVFPDARVKIFLTASAGERAKRRYKQLKDKGMSVSLSDLLAEIAERDARDTQRSASPLAPAADAIMLDTSEQDIDEVLSRVLAVTQTRMAADDVRG